MEYALEGQEISRICVDYAVTLQTGDGAELRLETGFTLAASETALALAVDPGDLSTAAAQVLALIRRRIVAVEIDTCGRLDLRFDHGGRLLCEPDEQFEAWALSAPDGEFLVCLPGGGTAHWKSGS